MAATIPHAALCTVSCRICGRTNHTHSLRGPGDVLRSIARSQRSAWHHNRTVRTRAVEDPDSDGGKSPVDIDALAQRLMQEAEKLRQQQAQVTSSLDLDAELAGLTGDLAQQAAAAAGSPAGPVEPRGVFGYESKQREADILAEVGDGGFCVSEFELLQELGRISVQQLSVQASADAEEGSQAGVLGTRTMQQQTVVIAFTARYLSGLPYEGPVTTFVKEYLPGAKAVACNELLVTKALTGMPDHKYAAAAADLEPDPPIIPLLGYFVAGSSESAMLASTATQQPTPFQAEGDAETLWLVFKWEKLLPLASYATARQNTPSFKGLLWIVAQPPDPVQLRASMLRRIMFSTLRCLAYCHERGVIHGSVGPSSFLMSTFEDHKAGELVVKLTDFGFARLVSRGTAVSSIDGSPLYATPLSLDDDDPLALGQKEDIRALACVLVEVVCSALAWDGPNANPMTGGAVQRLLFEVFNGNADDFRQYCDEEPQLVKAVAFLDGRGGAGWGLLGDMMKGVPAAMLLEHPFLAQEDPV